MASVIGSPGLRGRARFRPGQLALGACLVVVAVLLAASAASLPVDKGYSILGPQVFPLLVAAFVGLVGVLLCWQAATGGYRDMPVHEQRSAQAEAAGRAGALWVTAGVAAVALLITHIGFVLAAAVLFACAARGFGSRRALIDLGIGIALTLPVYWLFTSALGVKLPPLVNAWI